MPQCQGNSVPSYESPSLTVITAALPALQPHLRGSPRVSAAEIHAYALPLRQSDRFESPPPPPPPPSLARSAVPTFAASGLLPLNYSFVRPAIPPSCSFSSRLLHHSKQPCLQLGARVFRTTPSLPPSHLAATLSLCRAAPRHTIPKSSHTTPLQAMSLRLQMGVG